MDEARLKQVTSMLRAVLMSSKEGVPLHKINGDYRGLTGQPLPFHSLGFATCEDFLRTIPDVVNIRRNNVGEMTCFAVADKSTVHIQNMVQRQKGKSKKKSRPSRPTYRPSSAYSRRPFTPRPSYTPASRSQSNFGSRRSPSALPARSPFRVTFHRTDARSVNLSNNNKSELQAPVQKPIYKPPVSNGTSKSYEVPPRFQTKNHIDEKTTNDSTQSEVTKDYKGGLHSYCSKNKIAPLEFETMPVGKGGGFVCSISVKKKVFGSLGVYKSKKEAEQAASKNALQYFNENQVSKTNTASASTSTSIPEDELKQRIHDLVMRRPNGLWNQRLSFEYKETYGEDIPSNIHEKMKSWNDVVTVESVPHTENKILYPVKKSTHRLVQSQQSTEKIKKINPLKLSVSRQKVKVYLAHVEDCSEFYIHLYDSCITEIVPQMNEVYEGRGSPKPLQSFPVGCLVAAQFEDQNWYRAEVRQAEDVADETKVHVFYVDFGNYDVVQPSRTRRLSDNFYAKEAQAIRCSLKDVYPLQGGEWDDKSTEEFKCLVCDEEEDAIFSIEVIQKEKESYAVNLYKGEGSDQVNVNTLLVSRHLASPYPAIPDPSPIQLPDEDVWDVYVSYIISTAAIIVRLVGPGYSDDLEKLEQEMKAYATQSSSFHLTLDTVQIGHIYCAVFEETWFRVKVLNKTESMVEVLFLDCSEVELVSVDQLYILNPSLNILPYQAISCKLHGLESLADNERVTSKLCELALGKTCVAEVVSRDDEYRIVLNDTTGETDVNINEMIVQDEDLQPKLPNNENIDVHITHVSDEGHVFVQIPGSGLSRLDKLMEDVGEYFQSKRLSADQYVSTPDAGRLCCTKYDESWWRVEVIQVLEDRQVEVKFVDLGNSTVLPLNSLREFPKSDEHVHNLPYQAVECALTGLPPDGLRWSQEGLDNLLDLISQCELYSIKVDTAALPESMPIISVYMQEEDGLLMWLNETLMKEAGNFRNMFEEVETKATDEKSELMAATVDAVTESLGATYIQAPPGDPGMAAGDHASPYITMYPRPSVGEYFDVHIVSVESLDSFVIIPYELKEEFNKMKSEMNEEYSKMEIVKRSNTTLREGDLFAAQYEDDLWYRVSINSVLDDEHVKVYFIDLCEYDIKKASDLQFLQANFRKLPNVACKASIDGLKPVREDDCTKRFTDLVLHKDLVALIFKDKNELSVRLVDTSQEESDVIIDEVLLSEGLATR